MQVDYITYWSILDTPSRNIQSGIVSLCVAFGAILIWLLTKKYKKETGNGDKKTILWATGAFAVIGFTGYILSTFFYPDKSNDKTLEILNPEKTPMIEGIVSNFERTYRHARYGDETIEKFTVDSIQFAYGDALLGKFNSFSQTNNNVIFNGQHVRITYRAGSVYGNYKTILKLEIAK